MNRELVSIIMPAYNAASTIEKSIQSVLSQTYDKWELIIVDDLSKDNTVEVVEKYLDDTRIKLIINSVNSRAAVTRNNGLEIAKGKYIAFLDSDDIWIPEKLEVQIGFMKQNKVGFSFTSYDCFNEIGQSIDRIITVPDKISAKKLLRNTIIGCSTTIVDKEIVGDFRFVTNNRREDMFTWYLVLDRGFEAYGIKKIMTHYRVASSSSSGNKFKMAKEYWRGLKDIAQMNFFERCFCFCSYAMNAIKKRL